MSTHTPGPWEAFDSLMVGANGTRIADCENIMQPDHDEKRANAKLIASAPALLEALEIAEIQLDGAAELLSEIGGDGEDDKWATEKAIQCGDAAMQARKAIHAAAKGGD